MKADHTYSYPAGRYVEPGEMVIIDDEFGYGRNLPPVEFLGRDGAGFYRYRDDSGTHAVSPHVVRDVIPATPSAADLDRVSEAYWQGEPME